MWECRTLAIPAVGTPEPSDLFLIISSQVLESKKKKKRKETKKCKNETNPFIVLPLSLL